MKLRFSQIFHNILTQKKGPSLGYQGGPLHFFRTNEISSLPKYRDITTKQQYYRESFSIPKDVDVTDLGAIREEGPKVYQDWGEGWVLVFDFSLNVGDFFMGLTVESVDTIEVKGRKYRRLSFGMKLDYGDFGKNKEYCWMEATSNLQV